MWIENDGWKKKLIRRDDDYQKLTNKTDKTPLLCA